MSRLAHCSTSYRSASAFALTFAAKAIRSSASSSSAAQICASRASSSATRCVSAAFARLRCSFLLACLDCRARELVEPPLVSLWVNDKLHKVRQPFEFAGGLDLRCLFRVEHSNFPYAVADCLAAWVSIAVAIIKRIWPEIVRCSSPRRVQSRHANRRLTEREPCCRCASPNHS